MQDRLLLSYYVSGQTNGPTLKDKPVHRLTLEDGTDWLFRNVNNYQYTLRNAPEESRSLFRDRLNRSKGYSTTERIKSIKNLKRPQLKSNPRPSGLTRSALNNRATAYPAHIHDFLEMW